MFCLLSVPPPYQEHEQFRTWPSHSLLSCICVGIHPGSHQFSWPQRIMKHSRLDCSVRDHRRLSPSPLSIVFQVFAWLPLRLRHMRGSVDRIRSLISSPRCHSWMREYIADQTCSFPCCVLIISRLISWFGVCSTIASIKRKSLERFINPRNDLLHYQYMVLYNWEVKSCYCLIAASTIAHANSQRKSSYHLNENINMHALLLALVNFIIIKYEVKCWYLNLVRELYVSTKAFVMQPNLVNIDYDGAS